MRGRHCNRDFRIPASSLYPCASQCHTRSREAQETAHQRGINLSDLRGQRIKSSDFAKFDYILPMDEQNYEILFDISPQEYRDKIKMFLSFSPTSSVREVPDPYYGGPGGFDQVFDMVEAGSRGLLEDIMRKHGLADD